MVNSQIMYGSLADVSVSICKITTGKSQMLDLLALG